MAEKNFAELFESMDLGDLERPPYRALEDRRRDLAVKLTEGILVDLKADYEERGNEGVWWADNNPLPEELRPSHAMWMCNMILANKETWGSTRMHRWVGFIQAVLILSGVTGLEWEKNRVRELKKTYPED